MRKKASQTVPVEQTVFLYRMRAAAAKIEEKKKLKVYSENIEYYVKKDPATRASSDAKLLIERGIRDIIVE